MMVGYLLSVLGRPSLLQNSTHIDKLQAEFWPDVA